MRITPTLRRRGLRAAVLVTSLAIVITQLGTGSLTGARAQSPEEPPAVRACARQFPPAPADLDTSFARCGVLRSKDLEPASTLAVQLDSKVVIAGSVPDAPGYLARYQPDGNLDPSFGEGKGVAKAPVGLLQIDLQDEKSSDEQHILASGALYDPSSQTFKGALARYSADGFLDPTFGPNGTGKVKTRTSIPSEIAQDQAGRIVVAGGTIGNIVVERYTPDGVLDRSFGTGGSFKVGVPKGQANALLLQRDGKIVVAGLVEIAYFKFKVFVARFDARGKPDPEFNHGKPVVAQLGNGDSAAWDGILDRRSGSERIVIGGEAGMPNGKIGMLVARLLPDGSMDDSFGPDRNGKAITEFGSVNAHARSVVLEPGGKLVAVGGTLGGPGQQGIALARYTNSGELDPTFAHGSGKTITAVDNGTAAAFDAAFDPSGKKLVAAGGNVASGTLLAVRYLGSSDPLGFDSGTRRSGER